MSSNAPQIPRPQADPCSDERRISTTDAAPSTAGRSGPSDTAAAADTTGLVPHPREILWTVCFPPSAAWFFWQRQKTQSSPKTIAYILAIVAGLILILSIWRPGFWLAVVICAAAYALWSCRKEDVFSDVLAPMGIGFLYSMIVRHDFPFQCSYVSLAALVFALTLPKQPVWRVLAAAPAAVLSLFFVAIYANNDSVSATKINNWSEPSQEIVAKVPSFDLKMGEAAKAFDNGDYKQAESAFFEAQQFAEKVKEQDSSSYYSGRWNVRESRAIMGRAAVLAATDDTPAARKLIKDAHNIVDHPTFPVICSKGEQISDAVDEDIKKGDEKRQDKESVALKVRPTREEPTLESEASKKTVSPATSFSFSNSGMEKTVRGSAPKTSASSMSGSKPLTEDQKMALMHETGDDVKSAIGEPSRIESIPPHDEIWHYPGIGFRIKLHNNRVCAYTGLGL